MKRSLAVLLNAYVTMACIKAQIDILTVREAESVVERVPDVVAATNKGECPLLSATYAGDEQVDFQVRRSCGSNIGTLINNYTVNRRTGLVKLWGDDHKQSPTSLDGRLQNSCWCKLGDGFFPAAKRPALRLRRQRAFRAGGRRKLPSPLNRSATPRAAGSNSTPHSANWRGPPLLPDL